VDVIDDIWYKGTCSAVYNYCFHQSLSENDSRRKLSVLIDFNCTNHESKWMIGKSMKVGVSRYFVHMMRDDHFITRSSGGSAEIDI